MGQSDSLRQQCAEQLLEIGFDGYGYGGWPLDGDGNNLLTDVLAYTRELIPDQFTLHALGVGHPANVVVSTRLGYNIFDSTMPTQRCQTRPSHDLHHRSRHMVSHLDDAGKFFRYIYIKDKKHVKTNRTAV